MKSKKSSGKAKSAGKRRVKDLPARKGRDVKGGLIKDPIKKTLDIASETFKSGQALGRV